MKINNITHFKPIYCMKQKAPRHRRASNQPINHEIIPITPIMLGLLLLYVQINIHTLCLEDVADERICRRKLP